jgi:ABC-type nitrate/sulfonate/bicarbonate transport system ATPase subunit
MAMPLKITGLKKYYSGLGGNPAFKTLVLDNIDFTIPLDENRGKIITILAPYGAGKSTLLKIISAVETPSEGKILLDGKEYDKPEGKIVYIPENPSSFPWLNVKENIEFGLKEPAVNNDKVSNLISVVGLTGYEDHVPHNKSTGFRFRIALARALAAGPALVLIDDSFKNMKLLTKKELYDLVVRIKEELKINFLIATTNIHEAILLSDEIFMMKKDPGTIFKTMNVPVEINRGEFRINNEIISLRNEIESYFRGENVDDSISFSI